MENEFSDGMKSLENVFEELLKMPVFQLWLAFNLTLAVIKTLKEVLWLPNH